MVLPRLLPVAPAPVPAAPHVAGAAAAAPLASDARILVVDDNPDNRNVLARRLQRLGYSRIEEAVDGPEALRKNAAEAFDAMLLDVMMPGMTGVEVLGVMRAEGRLEDTPVIMISAATEIDTVVRCLELGAEDYLPKPFNPALLKARLSSVLDKKRLRAEVRRQLRRLDLELAQARQQQLSMVPSVFPASLGPVGADVHAVMRPAREVGGDLYDVFALGDEALCFAVGDVSGKGVPAALFMARTRSLLRASALQMFRADGRSPRPVEVASVLNEELCKNNPSCMFVTLFLGVLDLRTGQLRYLNAGHPRPYLLRRDGTIEELAGPSQPPLGAIDPCAFRDAERGLAPGEGLVVVTDGLAEAEDATGALYGAERIARDLEGLACANPADITDALTRGVTAFAGDTPAADDITVLALRVAGQPTLASTRAP